MGEFPGSKDRFVDENRVFPNQNDHKAIVIHGTGGGPNQTADQLGDFFETTSAMTSVHYGIDRAGNIDQYVREADGAGGNGILDPGHDPFWDQYADNPNWHTLSVETENDLTNSLPLTDPQKQALFKLVKYWVDKYRIPVSNIKGHFSLEPVERHNCPGPNFDWQGLWNYLSGNEEEPIMIDLNNGTVASHFTGDDNAWKCKDNGFIVGHGILSFYRKFGGDALCGLTYLGLPQSSEQPVAGKPGVVQQEFERATLRYDPGHTSDNPPGSGAVFVIHTDQDPRYVALQAQITTLQAQIAAMQPDAAAVALAALQAKVAQAIKDLS